MKKVMVPGTFDPITIGHLDVIERSAQLFDEVIIGVACSESKGGSGPLFSLEQRLELVRAATEHLDNVSAIAFSGLLVDEAERLGVVAVVKGLRAVTDFELEFQQAALNYHLNPDMETIFIMSAPEHMYLSSSVVKEIGQLRGDITGLVPPVVAHELVRHFGCVFRG